MINHHTDADTYKPNGTFSALGSILVHGLIVAGVFFAYTHQKPLPTAVSLEASLVTGDDLAGAKAAIAEAFASHQSASTTPQSPPSKSSTHSTKLDAYYDDLAERERIYQAQMAEYANNLDQEILSEIEMYNKAIKEAEQARKAEVAELESRERSNDEIARENTKALDVARERRDNAIAEAERANRQENKTLSDGQSTTKDSSPTAPTVGRGGAVSGGNDSGTSTHTNNKNEIIAALQRHIRSHWRQTGENKVLKVRLRVDNYGNVTSLSVSGGDDYLREQLEDTIRRASPLTPVVGTNYNSLNFDFRIN